MNPNRKLTPFERDLARQLSQALPGTTGSEDMSECVGQFAVTQATPVAMAPVEPVFDATTASPEELERHFQATPALRESFTGLAAYVAFLRHGGRDDEVIAADNARLRRELAT